jgi:hypothetical protein
MVVVGNNAKEDSQDGELGLDDQQLGNPAEGEDQPSGASDEEEPQGRSDDEAPEGDGVQDDQQVEEETAVEQEAAQESSGFAGQGPFSPDLKERVRQLEKQMAEWVAGKVKPGSFVFARTLEQAFGHQDPEQNARDKLDVLKQTGSVEDYANKFQSLVAEIVAMPPSEGDLLQKFRNGLKPDIQMAASIDPVTGTRWMNLRKFISFACATDASRAQATKAKHASDKSEQGKSSSSGASYKDKLKGKRPNESSQGQPAKKSRTGQDKQKSE